MLVVFAGVILTENANAQSITLGAGVTVNGTQTSSPVNIWYRRCVSNTVYTQAELNAAGITGPATIRQLGYYITQTPLYSIPGYTISMKHTNANNANPNLEGGFTVVKSASTYTPTAGGWDMINLTTPFIWNGTQNLIVRICWSQVQPNYDASGQCRTYAGTNGYKYRWDDNAGGACALVPNTTLNAKPQINLIFDTLTVWTGVLSTNWATAGNWTRGVPNIYMDAKIPVGTPNNPNLTATGICEELILQGTMLLAATGTLEVNSHFTNSGTFTDNGGITKLKGTGASNLSGTQTFSNLRIESTGGTTITSGITTIKKELQVNKSVFNTNNSVVMKSDATGTGRIAELKSTCIYMLTMNDSYGDGWNGGYLTVLENGVSIGTFSALGSGSVSTFSVLSGSTITLNYTSGSWENENSFNLKNPYGTTIYTDNAPIGTGNIYSTTAAGPFTPMVVGDISMERYIDAGETYWRYFTSAVQDATVGEYLDDFITSGFTGSPFPTFPFTSVYTYDETQLFANSYVPCSGSTQLIIPGQGLQVWAGDTITGTDPFTLDLTGQPNQGTINLPVTFTNTGFVDEDGWNLVGNPYASTIDWDSPNWTKANISNAIYIQNPDNLQYATYVSGASTNGGSRYVASQQSFWVWASAASPQLTANEGIKTSIDQAFIKDYSLLSTGANIRLQNSDGADEVVIRDVENSTTMYDAEFDAKEFWGGWGTMPQLSFVNTIEQDFTVHSFEFDLQEWTIPLRAVVFQNGIYNIVFQDIAELNVPCLKLEDTYTGLVYDIVEGSSLPFELSDTTWTPRFLLHIGKNYESVIQSSSCFDGVDGSIEIDLNDASVFNYDLTSNGTTISASANGDPLVINNLSSEIYVIEIPTLINNCGTTSFTFEVTQPTEILSTAQIEDELFGNDGSLVITVSGGVEPYTYLWDLGETTNQISNLSAGIYNLTLTDFNGCDWQGSFIVGTSVGIENEKREPVKFIYFPDFNKIQIYNWSFETNQELVLFNAAGQQIATYMLSAGEKTYNLNLPPNMATGMYLLSTGPNGEQFKFVKN